MSASFAYLVLVEDLDDLARGAEVADHLGGLVEDHG